MLDPAIQDFLNDRKGIWLKEKIKNNTNDEEKTLLEQQALDQFSLATWLPDAAKRAKQLSVVSHPGKFSHPSAKISPIIANAGRRADGLLRSGNVDAGLDVLGAGAMDVYKFLNLTLQDGLTILAHLENKTQEIEQQLTIPAVPYREIEAGLLGIRQDDGEGNKTSSRVKQVYFPVDGGYHLLSVLTPSNVMYKVKERINTMRFSDEAKDAREAKKANKHHETGLSEIYGLSVIGFGGANKQNISTLNNQNHGEAYLLPSLPPELSARSIQAPKSNFFSNTLWAKAYEEDFQKLHSLLSSERNNIHIRRQRDWISRHIIYQVVDRLWMVRYLDPGWSQSENYQQLPRHQKVWLDQFYLSERNDSTDWLAAIKHDFARWFLTTYQLILDKKSLSMGDEQLSYYKTILDECEEALR